MEGGRGISGSFLGEWSFNDLACHQSSPRGSGGKASSPAHQPKQTGANSTPKGSRA